MPTEDFLGKEPTPEEKPILRWVCIFKYPNSVNLEDSGKWYLEVHSWEVKQQGGLLRHVSYRTPLANSPLASPWVRVAELWYEDFMAWEKANLTSPPPYTPPPWGGSDPFVDMASEFAGYNPDVDFLKDNPVIP